MNKLSAQISIPLLNNKMTCLPCEEVSAREKALIGLTYLEPLMENYDHQESIDALDSLLNNSSEPLSNMGKLYCINTIIDAYIEELHINDTCVFNPAQIYFGDYDLLYGDNSMYSMEDFELRLKMTQEGFNMVNDWFEKAISIADAASKDYFQKKRLYYLTQSEILDELYEYNFMDEYKNYQNWSVYSLNQLIEKGNKKGVDMHSFEIANNDFRATNYCPYPNFTGLNIGFSSFYGKDLWLGGELGMDVVQFANPFKISDKVSTAYQYRVSTLGVGFHRNISTSDNDFSFVATRLSNIYFFNFTPAQFGFKWGPSFSDKAYWYYRPEIGFSYAIFTLSYGYNLMFNKDVRGLTDKSVINFKISYPLIKLGL